MTLNILLSIKTIFKSLFNLKDKDIQHLCNELRFFAVFRVFIVFIISDRG